MSITFVPGRQNGRWGFNYSKCYSMRVTHKIKPISSRYRMGDSLLEEVNHHPYLGVELASDLTWNKHINQITLKANRSLGLLKRNLSSCNRSTKEVAYKVLVCPFLNIVRLSGIPIRKITSIVLIRSSNVQLDLFYMITLIHPA